MNSSLRLFVGFKCMLDCYYWYKRETMPDFDYDVGGGWEKLRDSDISDNWVRLRGYIDDSPVILVVGQNWLLEEVNQVTSIGMGSLAYCNFKGIITRKDMENVHSLFISRPYGNPNSEIFAMIPIKKMRDMLASDHRCRTDNILMTKLGLRFDCSDSRKFSYNFVHSFGTLVELQQYMFEAMRDADDKVQSTEGNEDSVSELHNIDAVRFKNIYEVVANKGRAVDKYNTLIAALNQLGDGAAAKLNKLLAEKLNETTDSISSRQGSSSEHNRKPKTITQLFDDAVKQMGYDK